MYEGNHEIDKPGNEWTPEAVERLFIFCQLDRAMSYEKVCASYDYLMKEGYDSFTMLRSLFFEEMVDLMKRARVRFPKETAQFLYTNVNRFTGEKLMAMSRDEMVKECDGFGYKLASMFHNRLHGAQYAIIDVHIDRFLKMNGCEAQDYLGKEKFFIELAKKMDVTPDELDWEIWDANRIGKKKEEKHVAI